ncbi:hypothetical protein E2C01_007101 [Portunus trituberculatus]|uniref:Uncharacterized protein n=1 Tax=Portunus trituberculatus TaxID=210409 RepID=A0A5B7D1H2_PORTR|nr:hypothetical protein [Portunus trituberculatus]
MSMFVYRSRSEEINYSRARLDKECNVRCRGEEEEEEEEEKEEEEEEKEEEEEEEEEVLGWRDTRAR